MGGGSETFTLLVAAEVFIEEVPEYSPYGDGADSLHQRGYFLKDDKWEQLPPAPEVESAMARALREAKSK